MRNEESFSDDSEAQVPKADVPDPNGPPVPVENKPAMSLCAMGLSVAVAGGVVFMLISAATTSTTGATRSSELEWQQRQTEIEQAAEKCRPYRGTITEEDKTEPDLKNE